MDIEQLIHDAAIYIHDNYSEPVSVADIATQAHLSPSYFATVFKVLTGFTVKNYLNRYRLHRAATLLATSRKRIIEIAFEAGFLSQEAFTRSFAKTYGATPAQFRLLKPQISPFPPNNLWKGQQPMELMDCFKEVGFVKKDAILTVGLEVDIHYNTDDGTAPIADVWNWWLKGNYANTIPNRQGDYVYGITHSETADSTAKYSVCVEVSSLDDLPVGLVARKFPESEYAVFDTTLEIIWTGEFWRTFYLKWLPNSGYAMHEEAYRETNAAFALYPAIEAYDSNYKDTQSVIQIFAPVVKR